MTYLWYTYREHAPFGTPEGFVVHGFFTRQGGVLDGQTLKRRLGVFDTLEETLAAYPTAKSGNEWTDPQVINHGVI